MNSSGLKEYKIYRPKSIQRSFLVADITITGGSMVSSTTKVVSLIGNPVEHSVSPAMQNAAFEELGLDYVYLAFSVPQDSLSGALEGIKTLGIVGANVTIPHKSKVTEYLDELDEKADEIGAVNTISIENGKLKGFNTDGIGALRALKEEIEKIRGKNVLLLGAGGAARSIAFTLSKAGASLTISNRTTSKAEKLASEVEEKTGISVGQIPQKEDPLSEAITNSDILINSTSVGMKPNVNETLVKAENMHSDLTVMDIVYNPLQTQFLKEAEKIGAKTINGLSMLSHQGAASFKIWTGEDPPTEIMRKAARSALEEK